MTEYELPSRIDINDLLTVIEGYYAKGAHNNPVSTGDVEDITRLTDKVGRQTKFLSDVGILESAGHQRQLTVQGKEVAQALANDDTELAKANLRELLDEWGPTRDLIAFVRMQDSPTKEELLEYLAPEGTSTDDRGLRTLLDLYAWAGTITSEEDGESYTILEEQPSAEDLQASSTDPESAPTEAGTGPMSPSVGTPRGRETAQEQLSSAGNIDIQLQFSAEDNPDDIERVVLAVRRALTRNLEDEE